MSARAALLLAVALVLPLAACGGGETTATETETETETVRETQTETVAETGGVDLAQECENAQDGYAVRYPAGWHTNGGDVLPPCAFFHPEPFDLPEGTEPPPLAVSIDLEPVAFADVTGESPAVLVVSSEETEIGGRPAVRRETESTGEGLYPAGVRALEYLVDLDGETLIAVTRSTGELDFERNRTVLDRMAETLELR